MTFDLELDEINKVLNALAQRPFAEVYLLIAKIQAQGKEQMPKEEAAQ
jgi:hypothetical protein